MFLQRISEGGDDVYRAINTLGLKRDPYEGISQPAKAILEEEQSSISNVLNTTQLNNSSVLIRRAMELGVPRLTIAIAMNAGCNDASIKANLVIGEDLLGMLIVLVPLMFGFGREMEAIVLEAFRLRNLQN